MPGNYDLGTAKGTIELDASSLGRSAAALKTVGLGLTAVGVAALAGFGYVINKAATFEQVISGAQSALGATNAEMEIVKKTALELGANSIYGATNVARAIESLAFAGLSIQEIVGGAAKATIDLAQASGGLISLDEAGRTVANTMRTFGLSAKDATHIANELAGAANRSTIDISDMVTSFKYVGPVAHTAGLSIDDVSIALAELGDRGIRGSTAGTSLRGVLLGLVAPSEKARGVLEDLGIVTADGANIMFDSSGKMKSLAEVSQILQDHTKGLSREQKIAAFSAIFQRRAMASALVLAEQGKAGFAHYTAEIAKGGSASQIAATRLNNLKGDVALLKAQLETTVIKAGTPFQNFLRLIVRGLTTVIRAFGSLPAPVQTAILAFIAFAGVLLTTAGTLALLGSAVIKMYRVFKDLGVAIEVLQGLMEGLDAVLVANPIFLIVAAVIAVIAVILLLWFNWNKVWNFIVHHKAIAAVIAILAPFLATLVLIIAVVKYVQANWAAIWAKIQDVFQTAVAGIQQGWDAVARFFVRVWGSITDAFSTAWSAIQPILQSIGGFFSTVAGVVGGFVDAIVHQLQLMNAWFQHNVEPTLQAFADLFIAIWGRVTEVTQVAWSILRPILNLLGIVIKTVFNVAIAVIQGFVNVFRDGMNFVIANLKLFIGTFQAFWNPLWQGIQLVVALAMTAIRSVIGIGLTIIQAIWGPFWHGLFTILQVVWSLIKEVVDAAMLFIRGIIEIVTGLISGDWHKVWQGIKDVVAGVWDNIVAIIRFSIDFLRAIITDGLQAIVNLFTTLPGRILSALGDLTKTLFSHGVALLQGLWDGMISIFILIQQYVLQIPSLILGLLGDLGHLLWDVGKKLMQGLLDGIKSGLEGVKDFVTGIGSKLVSWKGPPAKDRVLLTENGSLIMEGLVKGLNTGLPAVKSAMTHASNIISSLQPTVGAGVGGRSSLQSLGLPSTGLPQGSTQAAPGQVHVVEKTGDTVHIETHTDANADEIVNRYFFAKKVRK